MKWDNREDDVREGKIGSFLSIRNVQKVNRFQKIAVEQSRLGIPLLIGLDVVHGLRTIFPIPLAESCAWDDDTFEESAHIAAKESASIRELAKRKQAKLGLYGFLVIRAS